MADQKKQQPASDNKKQGSAAPAAQKGGDNKKGGSPAPAKGGNKGGDKGGDKGKAAAKGGDKGGDKKGAAKPQKEKKVHEPKPKGYKSGLFVGLHRGHVVTKRPKRTRVNASRKQGKKVKFIRDLIREVSGYSPYEKRVIELLKVGLEKRALKYVKRKIGTHHRALHKREELQNVVNAARFAS